MKAKLRLQYVEDVLRQAAGIISTAAKILETAYGSCTPRTVRNYIKRNPRLAEVIQETIEANLKAHIERARRYHPGVRSTMRRTEWVAGQDGLGSKLN